MLTKVEAVDLLHRTLGHVAVQRIEDAINTGHVEWCHESRPDRFKKQSDPCVVCQLAKSKRRTFSSSQPVITEPGQHWYMDVWGPDETPSLIHMNVYTIGFRDAMSDAIWLYHSKTKDAVLDCVKDLYDRVIKPRRIAHGLKTFIIQSDNGEFKSNAVLDYLRSVGGERLTCCAYSPESNSKIERIWGILHNMTSAMLIEKKLPEYYWEFAQDYAAMIYNSIPPVRTRPGTFPRSPMEKFTGIKCDTTMFKVFGCRAFAHIDKSLRRKNHDAKAFQCVFIGIDQNSVKGYLLYSPEKNDIYVSTHVVFHPNHTYDGSYTEQHGFDTITNTNVPTHSIEQYKYLEGTNHIDPDDGLLYKVISVEEKNYPGQGTLIVCYRGHVYPNGKISMKASRDAYNVRDIEQYYHDYVSKVTPMVGTKHVEVDVNDKMHGISSILPRTSRPRREAESSNRPNNTGLSGKRERSDTSIIIQEGQTRKSPRLRSVDGLSNYAHETLSERSITEAPHDRPVVRPLLCEDDGVLGDEQNKDISTDLESLLHDNAHVSKLVEQAVLGDAIACHALTNDYVCVATDSEPNTIKQALSLPDRKFWKEAVDTELNMIKDFDVFTEPMPLPPGKKALNQRWVFKRKKDEHGNIIKYKARLTPQGCFQTFGVDFMDTYAPVARMTTVRFVLALAVILTLHVSGIDFTNAFLNAPLNDEIYVNAPPGCTPLPNGYVYKLKRALYGLKQSPREWNNTLHTFLVKDCNFTQLRTEHCLYIRTNPKDGSYCLICLYVDDMIVTYTNKSMFDSFLVKLRATFKITHSDELSSTLGFQIERTVDGGIFMHQAKYISDVLKRFGMSECRPVMTPSDHHIRLCKAGAYRVESSYRFKGGQSTETADDISFANAHKPNASYREVIGCLLWISMGTRPDITFAVNQCARYSSDPKPEHWTAVMRILRYLKGTTDYGLHFHRHSSQYYPDYERSKRPSMNDVKQPTAYASSYFPGTARVNLTGFSDADFANNIDDRRSITGYVFLLAGAPLSWNCQTQHTTALSTMESEYYAVCKAVQEALYLRMMFEETGLKVDSPLIIREDNKACISFSKDPGEHKRTKHIDYRHFFVRDQVNDGEVSLTHVSSENQLADIFTKSFDAQRFIFLRDHLVVSRATLRFVTPTIA